MEFEGTSLRVVDFNGLDSISKKIKNTVVQLFDLEISISNTLNTIRFIVADSILFEDSLKQLSQNVDDIVQVSNLPLDSEGLIDEIVLTEFYHSKYRCSLNSCSQTASVISSHLVKEDLYPDFKVFLGERQLKADNVHLDELIPKSSVNLQATLSIKNEESTESVQLFSDTQTDTVNEYSSELIHKSSETHNPPLINELSPPFTLLELLEQRASQDQPPKLIFLSKEINKHDTINCKQLHNSAKIFAENLRAKNNDSRSYIIIHIKDLKNTLIAFWGSLLARCVPVITTTWISSQPTEKDFDKLNDVWKHLDNAQIIVDTPAGNFLKNQCQHDFSNSELLKVEDLVSNAVKSTFFDKPSNTDTKQSSISDDIAFLNLTSGSTGTPKCVALTHKNILARGKGTIDLWQNTREDITLNWLPFDHIGSLSDWHIRCVLLGCDSIYAPTELILSNPVNWLDLINQYRVTHTWATDSAYKSIINTLKKSSEKHSWNLSCVNTFLNAAEPIAESTARDLTSILKPYQLRTNCIVPAFGMAELGSGINYSRPQDGQFKKQLPIDRASLSDSYLKIVKKGTQNSVTFTSLGPIIPGMSMRIIDENFHTLPELSVGQLQVKGSSLSKGYLHNDAANNALIAKDGWFNTGDKGFIYKGELYLSGRTKDTLIINGKNFSPIDFEEIVDSIPEVKSGFSAAIQTKGEDGSEENLVIFFCPVKKNSSNKELKTLVSSIKDRIIEIHQLTPDFIIPEAAHNIPKTSIQKIQRTQLVKRFESGDYKKVCKKIDLLIGSERTVENWFANYKWTIDYGSADQYQSTEYMLVLLSTLTPEICRFLTIESASAKKILVIAEEVDSASINWPQAIPSENIFYLSADNLENTSRKHHSELTLFLNQSMVGNQYSIIDFRLFSPATKNLENGSSCFEYIVATHNPLIATLISDHNIISKVTGYILVGNQSNIEPTLFWALSTYYRTLVFDYISRNLPTEEELDLAPPSTKAVYFDLSLENKSSQFSEKLKLEITRRSPVQEVLYSLEKSFKSINNTSNNIQTINSNVNNFMIRKTRRIEQTLFSNNTNSNHHLQPDSWVLITGGLGGIGFEISQWLQSKGINLVIVGSRDEQNFIIENMEQFKRLQSLRKNGKVLYKTHKISSGESLYKDILLWQKDINQRFSTIFHTAGVVANDDSQFIKNIHLRNVWRTKVEGALAINHLLTEQPETTAVYFSSVMASNHTLGSPAYSAANCYLQELAQQQRSQGQHVHSIAWSAWKGVGLSKDLPSEIIKKQGLCVLSKRAALASLEGIIAREPSNVTVGINFQSIQYQKNQCSNLHSSHKRLCVFDNTGGLKSAFFNKLTATKNLPVLGIDSTLIRGGSEDHSALRKLFKNSTKTKIEPRNDLEKSIAGIWESILGHNDFGITDSFYSVGGSSMLTTTMHSTMMKLWSIKLDLGDLYEHSSIQTQAEIISTKLQEYSTSVTTATESADNRKDRVLCLQKNTSNTPIFCLCGIELYSELAKAFKDIAPVYAIYLNMEEQAIRGDRTLQVPEMAEAYLNKIRDTQPNGPYRLMGLSFGAAIAFEVAQRLISEGEKVELLGILDFNLPLNLKSNQRISEWKFKIKDSIRLAKRKLLGAVANVHQSFHLKPEIIEVHYTRAFHSYKKTMKLWPQSENIIVFRAEHEIQHKGLSKDINGGWHQLMIDPNAPLEAHLIEGNHLGILKGNGPHQIAALIKDKLAVLS